MNKITSKDSNDGTDSVLVRATSMADEGVAVARVDGKALFIEDALPGELVRARYLKRKRRFDRARVEEIIEPSAHRVEPTCEYVGQCGGCVLQHLDSEQQLLTRQQLLLEKLNHIGGVEPEQTLLAISGPVWAYRSRARLTVRATERGRQVVVGFLARGSHRVAEITSCEILDPRLVELLPHFKGLILSLSVRTAVPGIEFIAADSGIVVLLPHTTPLSEQDKTELRGFAAKHQVSIYLQSGNRDVLPLGDDQPLHYSLPEFDLTLNFGPGHFTQINPEINRKLVARVMELLKPVPGDRIADLFCGIGNLTLPIGRLGADALGLELIAQMVEQATFNAAENGLTERCSFDTLDLLELQPVDLKRWGRINKVLLDPPRGGALAVCQVMRKIGAERVVYVSCDPATLARDAKELVENQGYRLEAAGVLDMFPHTGHVESVALFVKA